MTAETDAYGVYPGGQSGNPGSKYYATFIDKWAKGEYNKLLFLPDNDKQDNKALKYKWTIKGK
jgi:penicillin amidase